MRTTPPTRPTLLGIAHDGPVRAREVGQSGEGVDWIVQPEDLDALVAHINAYGGPAAWDLTPLDG